jgi:tripartite-type tricarboxylate transporter receptor subunit TctC
MSPQGLFAPAGTPPAIVNRLHQELAKTLNGDDVKQKLMNAGSQVVTNTPDAFAAVMRRDIDRLTKLIQAGRIPVE